LQLKDAIVESNIWRTSRVSADIYFHCPDKIVSIKIH